MKDDKNRKIEKQKNREREKEKERKRETRTLFGSLRSTAVDNIIYKYLYTYIYLVIYIPYRFAHAQLDQCPITIFSSQASTVAFWLSIRKIPHF